MNPNQCEHCFIQIESQSECGLIMINSDWKFSSDSSEFIQIEFSDWIELSRINFKEIFNKRDWKICSNWYGLILMGSDTDIGMIRNNKFWFARNEFLSETFTRDIYPSQFESIRTDPKIVFNLISWKSLEN